MSTTTVGLFVGLLLGLALALGGFGDMVIVGFVGTAGYLVAKVLEGELDLSEYLGSDGPVSRRRRQP
jgi:hypothetical protein